MDFILKTAKRKLPLHENSFVKATALSLLWPKICLPVLQAYCSTRCSWFTVAVWQESNTAYICIGI